MRNLLALLLLVASVTSNAQTPDPISDVLCTVSLVMHDSEVEVSLTGELLLDNSAFLGFYSGCIGYTGHPVQIAPGDFEVSLVYDYWQSPLWLTPDLWENYGDPTGYPCYEELGLSLCSDSTNWWTIDQDSEELWHGLIAESFVPLQQSFNLDGSNGYQWPINVVPGNGSLCGEGTAWDSTLQQCTSIGSPCASSCGEGTVWDPVNEECIVAIPADINFDGCVTVNDLLELLAVHGTCPPYPEWPDEPDDTAWACGNPLTYWDYDYATVLIGDQCWFADNLRSTQYQTGDSIVLWDYEGEVDTYGLGHYTYKDLNTANADTFGLLYTWHAATHELQLCPTGWHTPSQQEFQDLMIATDVISGDLSSTAQVTALQSSSIWTLGTGSNATGFSALPGSQRTPWGGLGYGDQYEEAFWWTSDQDGFDFVNLSLAEPLNGEEKQIGFGTCDNPNDGMSVRCIQD